MATAKKSAKKATKSARGANGKAKSVKRMPSNKKWAGVTLPPGFNAINTNEYGQRWDFEEKPILQGICAAAPRDVPQGTGKNKRTTRVIDIKGSDGSTTAVWESAALQGFFDEVKKGSKVAIAFQGYRDVGRPQPMKVFVAGIGG